MTKMTEAEQQAVAERAVRFGIHRQELRVLLAAERAGPGLPPYGTRVTPDDVDFESALTAAADFSWFAAVRLPDGRTARFTVSADAPEDEVGCEIDGRVQECIQAHTHLSRGPSAPVEAWWDWLQRSFVALGQHDEPWAGDGIEAQLERVERNIVYADTQTSAARRFADTGELEVWLTGVYAPSGLLPRVRRLDADAYAQSYGRAFTAEARAGDGPSLMSLGVSRQRDESEPTTVWYASYLDTTADPAQWFPADARIWQAVRIFADGGTVEAFDNDRCFDSGELAPYVRDGVAPIDADAWLVVEIAGVPGAQVFPAADVMLVAASDRDAAEISLEVGSIDGVLPLFALHDGFLRRWGPIVDPDAVVPEADLDRLEARVMQQIAETRG